MTIRTPYYSFTRPANTTAYASGDLVANDTTAASVVPLSWGIEGMQGCSGIIRGVRFYKSSTTVTAASFRVHLFTASPGVPTNGDNGALAVASAADFLDTVAVDCSSGAFVGTAGVKERSAAVAIPFKLATLTEKLYGLIDVQGAYAPASGETFTVTLELESAT
jgi:hypothetical protein